MVASILVFPGQGAQRVGMGKDLAERFVAAREVFEAIDDALGMSLSALMWHGPEVELTRTHNAQPAILAHSLAVHAAVRAALTPVAGAGHSVGEYSAYAAAGSIAPDAAARLVRRRGELMHEASAVRAGMMAAVLGLPTEVVDVVCREATVDGSLAVPANINAPDQTVISGDTEAVGRAGERCRSHGAKRVVPLKVAGAFHSPLMAPAAHGLAEVLGAFAFRDPEFPIVANARAEAVAEGGAGRALLVEQLTAPVRWVDCMRRAVAIAGEDVTVIELGPGRVLAGLMKRIAPEVRAVSLGGAGDVTAFLERAA